MKQTKRGIAILLSLLLLSSCGVLRPADGTGTTASTETQAQSETESAENGGALSFGEILANYEARQEFTANPEDNQKAPKAETIPASASASADSSESGRPEASYSQFDLDDSIPADAVRIELNGTDADFDGAGLSLADGVLTVSAEGTYLLTGSFTGQIRVDAGKDAHVRLILSGVSLSGSMAPIYVVSADKATLTLAEWTENTVSDTANYVFSEGEDEPDAAIFSKEDLTINGTGSLTVTGNYKNGIVSKDDLKIVSGEIRVTAVYNGIKGKDSLTVRDGVIEVEAGNDAMKASNDSEEDRGWVIFEGGITSISAGDDAIHAETWLLVYGGNIHIAKSNEGLEAMKVEVYGGDISVTASDDAINAASGSSSGDVFGGGNFGGFGGRGGMTVPGNTEDTNESAGNNTQPDFENMTPPDAPDGMDFSDRPELPDGEMPDFGDMTPPDMPDGMDFSDRPELPEGMQGNFGGQNGFGGQGGFGGNPGGMPTPSTNSDTAETPTDNSVDTLFGGRGGRGNQQGGGRGGMNNEQPEDGVWILIAGGTIRAQGGNDILDTNGTFTQTGGTIIACGANMSIYGDPDAILDTNGTASIDGGTFAAFCRSTGNSFAGILSSPAVACTSLNGAETVSLADADGTILLTIPNGTRAQSVVLTSDLMAPGETYTLILGDRTVTFTAADASSGVQTIR